MADPLIDSAVSDQPAGATGYCIEIHVAADGSMKVGVDTEKEESAEGDDGGATPVSGLKQLMDVVMDIVKNNGQVSDAAAQADEDFNAGFSGAPDGSELL